MSEPPQLEPPDPAPAAEPKRAGLFEDLDDRQIRQLKIVGALVVVAILVLLFIVQNSQEVEVSFVLFRATTSLIWVIVLSLIAGAIGSQLVGRLLRRRFGRRRD